MSDRTVRHWGYLDLPIATVQAKLHDDPLRLIERATASGARRTQDLIANLEVAIGSLEIGVEIRPHVESIQDMPAAPGLPTMTQVALRWEAAKTPVLFPLMQARLEAWPIGPCETLVELAGEYKPPLGILGGAADAMFGHRLAEASVATFLENVLSQIRCEEGGGVAPRKNTPPTRPSSSGPAPSGSAGSGNAPPEP
jgi:hypothetical protein